jgi:hypothetical protein
MKLVGVYGDDAVGMSFDVDAERIFQFIEVK